MTKTVINVLIADDHNLVRAGIRSILSNDKQIKVVGEAGTGEEAIKLVRELSPRVVLMDLKMPGIGGLEATRKILHFNPEVRVLVVTMYEDNIHPVRLLQVGAAGYLTKEADPSEMLQAIHAVNIGQRFISPMVAQQMVLKDVTNDGTSPFEILSDRELQVVFMVTKGIKAPEIARKLNLSSKTINTYRYRIFKKLKVEPKSDVVLAQLAMQYNLIDES